MNQLDRIECKVDELTKSHNEFQLKTSVEVATIELRLKQASKIFGAISGAVVSIIVSILISKYAHAEQLKDVVYKKNMEINGRVGMVVFPYSDVYSFYIKADGKLDWFQFTTCHRNIGLEDASNIVKTIFKIPQSNELRINYKPTIAEQGYCPVRLDAFEKGKGRHSRGFIDFEQPDYKLNATVYCNGNKNNFNGVSVCEAKNGLVQIIEFDHQVYMTSDCIEKEKDGKQTIIVSNKFEIESKFGIEEYCVYNFMDKNKDKHRLTLAAYDEIALME